MKKEDKKVNLFVVGAMKAGTTSFVDLLSQHPEIYVPPVKEPHFFIDSLPENLYEPSRFFDLDNYLEKNFPEPLHITKIETKEQYDKIFSLRGDKKYLVDASTAYLHAPESPSQIYKYNSDSKIIILLRDPLQRAYSHYKMDLGLGRVKGSFEELVKKDIESFYRGNLNWSSYIGMSFYNNSIERFKNLFKDVLIIEFDQFVNNKQLVLRKISNFLKIDPFSQISYTHKNTTKILRYQNLFYLLKKTGLKDYFSISFGFKFKQWLFRRVSKDDKKSIILSSKTMKEVKQIFIERSTLC